MATSRYPFFACVKNCPSKLKETPLLQHPAQASLPQEAYLKVSLNTLAKSKIPRSTSTNFHYSFCQTITQYICNCPWRNTRSLGVKCWQPLSLPTPTPANCARWLLVEQSTVLHSCRFRTKLLFILSEDEHSEEQSLGWNIL